MCIDLALGLWVGPKGAKWPRRTLKGGGPGPRALGPVGPLIAAAHWKKASVESTFSCCNWIFAAVIRFLAAVIGFLAAVIVFKVLQWIFYLQRQRVNFHVGRSMTTY